MIENIDNLVKALGNKSSRIVLDKASIASQTANSYCSLWRATGQPGQGAIPTVVATCNNTTVGTIGFNQQTSPITSYGAYLEIATSNAAMTMELHDRLASKGGLNGTLTTAQSVNLDLSTLLSTDNINVRKGDNNSDVKTLQDLLIKKGYKISSDGNFGELTEKAVIDFQTKNKLTVDGIAGKGTFEKLS